MKGIIDELFWYIYDGYLWCRHCFVQPIKSACSTPHRQALYCKGPELKKCVCVCLYIVNGKNVWYHGINSTKFISLWPHASIIKLHSIYCAHVYWYVYKQHYTYEHVNRHTHWQTHTVTVLYHSVGFTSFLK